MLFSRVDHGGASRRSEERRGASSYGRVCAFSLRGPVKVSASSGAKEGEGEKRGRFSSVSSYRGFIDMIAGSAFPRNELSWI